MPESSLAQCSSSPFPPYPPFLDLAISYVLAQQDAKVTASVSEISGPLGSHLALERRALRKAA